MIKRADSSISGVTRAYQRGMSLIELMVAIVVGVVLSLAIFGVLVSSEGIKRTTTSVNDINQAGNYAAYSLDKLIRSAGSGFSSPLNTTGQGSGQYAYSCPLYAQTTAQILPLTAVLPAPFDTLSVSAVPLTIYRLAPIIIIPGGTTPAASGSASDVIIVMSGSAGGAEVAKNFSDYATASTLALSNTLGFNQNDIILLAEEQASATADLLPCFIEKVDTPVTGNATAAMALHAGYATTVATKTVASMGKESAIINLGNIVKSNPPSFLVLGVGDNNTLFSYDLLQTSATPLIPMADGVFEMHALYGVDTEPASPAEPDGIVDAWVSPSAAAGSYTLAALMAGTRTATDSLKRIKSIRIALIMRTSLAEKTAVSPAALTMFADLKSSSAGTVGDMTFTRNLAAATAPAIGEQNYRYRVVESTIPLRNLIGQP